MKNNTTQFNDCFNYLSNKGVEVHSLDAERTETPIPLLEESWLKENAEYVKHVFNHRFRPTHEILAEAENNRIDELLSLHNATNDNVYLG